MLILCYILAASIFLATYLTKFLFRFKLSERFRVCFTFYVECVFSAFNFYDNFKAIIITKDTFSVLALKVCDYFSSCGVM